MKNKKTIIYIILVTLVFVGLLYLVKKNKPVDWSPTFVNIQKNPYDTYIPYHLLKDVFPTGKVRSTRLLPYNELQDMIYIEDDDSVSYNIDSASVYVFINKEFELQNLDLDYLLDFVYFGGNVFISAEKFGQNLTDSLSLTMNNGLSPWMLSQRDTIKTNHYLTDVKDKTYQFSSIMFNSYFVQLPDSLYNCRILGYAGNKENVTFVEMEYGDGKFYLNTNPVAFTNVTMLDSAQYDYAFRCLSYLPRNSSVIWDESQKEYPFDYGKDTPFQVILRYPPLKMAFIVTLIGFALFMLFRSKRSQRIIPVVKPPANTSVEFLDTISNLYYINKDYRSIAEYRYNFFLDTVRKKYYLKTERIDDDFVKSLSLKSRVDLATVEQLFANYRELTLSGDFASFMSFDEVLEDFYRISK
ncbi:MAG: DUF4350 domain-containing protein [Dysgonomonas sp.]